MSGKLRVRLKSESLLAWLTKHNMNQATFAYEECISNSYLTEIIRGYRCASAPVRQKIMEGCGLSWESLFEYENPVEPSSSETLTSMCLVKTETKWIPTAEKLPANNDNVLAFYTGQDVVMACYHDETLGGKGWWSCDHLGTIYPTHWMPLPDPPCTDKSQNDAGS